MGRVGRRWNLRRTTTSMRANPGVGWPSIQRALALLLKSVRNRKRFFFFFFFFACFLILLPARQSRRLVRRRWIKHASLALLGGFACVRAALFRSPWIQIRLLLFILFFLWVWRTRRQVRVNLGFFVFHGLCSYLIRTSGGILVLLTVW